ncbi:MAG: hypothetical protein IMY77_04375 [Chloroflexi bacterium]|nr:hypothetical protein [Chloroflexota bacterium]
MMARTTQDRKDEWEREHVQRVLDYHNEKYGTHIAIKDKTTEVYPHLEGQLNWDWVCYDTETGDEIAVEVKRITKQILEKKRKEICNLLDEVTSSLSNKLTGTFSLFVDTYKEYNFPFKKQPESRQTFKDILSETIIEVAQRLNVGETEDLKPEISERLLFMLPDIILLELKKLNNQGSVVKLHHGTTGCYSISFDELELEKFEQLVSHANEQLKQSNTKETFLVLIEERERPIDPPEIMQAFTNINAESYSEMRHVYFMRGGEVTEIPLPIT